VKTTISIPDELFHQVETWSRRLKMSRREFFATAAREYLARYDLEAIESWNRVAAEINADPATAAFVRYSKAVIRANIDRA